MRRYRTFSLVLVASLAMAAAAPAPGRAQDATTATAAELQTLFQRQKSRGLKLAPGTGVATAVGVSSPDGTVVTATTDAQVLVPVAYAELDDDDQVNIRIAFDFDSAVLRDSEAEKLAQLCLAMKVVDVDVFRIVGHTDAAGSDDYNDRLSLLRAEEVKRHLVSDCGLADTRLQAVGMGKRYLSNPDDPRGEENRRVEFQALS